MRLLDKKLKLIKKNDDLLGLFMLEGLANIFFYVTLLQTLVSSEQWE